MEATPETEATPAIGHNQGPELLTGDALVRYLEITYADEVERTVALLEKGAQFLTIATDEEDAEATEFMVKLRARFKGSEASRVKEKTPFDDNAGIVHAFFKTNILDPLGRPPENARASYDPITRTDLGMGPRINMAQTIYKAAKVEAERNRREEEAKAKAEEERKARLAAQEAERQAREAEQAAARKRNEDSRKAAEEQARIAREKAEAARAAENRAAEERAAAEREASASAASMSQSRGDRGGVSSLKTFVDFRDLNREAMAEEARMVLSDAGNSDYPLTILMLLPYISDKALEQAVKGWIDANKGAAHQAIKTGVQPMRGVVIFENHRSSGRA